MSGCYRQRASGTQNKTAICADGIDQFKTVAFHVLGIAEGEKLGRHISAQAGVTAQNFFFA